MFKTNVSKFLTARKVVGLLLAMIAVMSIMFGTVAHADTWTPCPAGMATAFINTATGDAVFIKDQFPAPNDNSYGINAVGWGTKGHTFKDLVGSDHTGFLVKNPSGTVVLNFNIDFISAKSGTPSGYGSLGPFGGDGGIVTGTLTPSDVTWDSSLARNLNNTGYFASGIQVGGDTNLLVNSPATVNTTNDYTLKNPGAWTGSYTNPETTQPGYPGNSSPSTVVGWDFHNTYYATVKASKMLALGAIEQVNGQWQLKAGWSIGSNGVLHNSPAKTCPTNTPTPTPTPTMTPTPTTTPTPPSTTTPTPPTTVPEPATIILFGSGLMGLGGAAARRFFGKKNKDSESEEDSE